MHKIETKAMEQNVSDKDNINFLIWTRNQF